MKIFRLRYFSSCLFPFFCHGPKPRRPFPPMQEAIAIQVGDLTWKTGVLEVKDEK